MFLIYYFSIVLSLIGYGYLLSKVLKLNFKNYGYLGLLGLSMLIFISYSTSLFFKHSYLFNLVVLLFGILSCFFLLKKDPQIKKNLIQVGLIFFILVIFILVGKNHDDFPYYHFPYSHLLTQIEHPIGLGQLNNGFRNHSSLFFLNSLFYLPVVDIFLMHISPVYFLGFSNLILLDLIRSKQIFLRFKLVNIFALLSFVLINIFFYRLSEHGTDRSGMILIFILTLMIIQLQNFYREKNNLNLFFFICIITPLLISLKTYYIIYSLLLFYVFYDQFKNKFFLIITSRVFFYSFAFFLLTLFYNFLNSGCIIYPANFTCFENLQWSLDSAVIKDVNQWYELWAKSGASPNYVIENRAEYLKNFNWLSNWIQNYFFNKMSDFLLALIFLILVFWVIFKNKNYVKKQNQEKIKIKFLFFLFFLYLVEWFVKHPSLRYGGYHILPILIFIPFAIWYNKLNVNYELFIKRVNIILLITLFIFVSRNINRLANEYNQYEYNPLIDYRYTYDQDFYYRYFTIFKTNKNSYKNYNFLGKKFIITH